MSSTSAAPKAGNTTAPATRATHQDGIIGGQNPTVYDPTNPLTIFIIQAAIIIIFCRLLHWPLSKIRQPRVIAEVIGGILLGPSVMGRIPGFKAAIFPDASMPLLNLTANLGLVLFLFLVALEVDMRIFLSNWRVAVSVGALGMILPFGLGAAIAWGLYNEFNHEPGLKPTTFGVFMLFIGVAMAITAFPVLCRILTELKLLNTNVGVIVLSAGVGNDVVGWILLALTVALVNAGSGITALWVLLTSIGWTLFLVYAVRPAYMYYLRATNNLENGPSQSAVSLTLLMVLASAFFTNVIGVHAIFGGFLVGLICPHDGGFAIKMAEKIEDFVSVLFLPLYFALSGLKTNIGLLDNGITWAYVIGVTAIAFIAKITGGTIAARLNKMLWRESFAIGVLMSCKGLVELIVLNIGLQAGILSTRTFTIFVVMALITTFATTPLTTFIYPPSYQRKVARWRRGEIDWDGNPTNAESSDASMFGKSKTGLSENLLVLLRLRSLPSLCVLLRLLGRETVSTAKVHRLKVTNVPEKEESPPQIAVHGLRLLQVTDRDSSMMRITEADEHAARDPVINVFKTMGQMNSISVTGDVIASKEESYADTLVKAAADRNTDLLLLPWDETTELNDEFQQLDQAEGKFSAKAGQSFIMRVFEHAACDTAVFVNKELGGSSHHDAVRKLTRTTSGLSLSHGDDESSASRPYQQSHHIFLPFFGGADDRVALRLVLQFAKNPNITATILYVRAIQAAESTEAAEKEGRPIERIKRLMPTRKSVGGTSRPASVSEAAGDHDFTFFASMKDSLPTELEPRVVFETLETAEPLKEILARAKVEVGNIRNLGDIVVVGRGSRKHYGNELVKAVIGSGALAPGADDTNRTLGSLAELVMFGGVKASTLVVQAAYNAVDSDADSRGVFAI